MGFVIPRLEACHCLQACHSEHSEESGVLLAPAKPRFLPSVGMTK
jgi:hypothetical protein